MKYPFWLPKPRRHWLRSIELLILSIPVVFILRLLTNAVIINSLVNTLRGGFPSSLASILWLAFFLLFPPLFFAYTYQLLHDEGKLRKFPSWRCLINGWAYWLIYLVSILTSFLVWLDFTVISGTSPMTEQEYIEDIIPMVVVTWIITAAYLFMLKDGIVWLFKELIKLLYALVGKTPKWVRSEKSQNDYVEKD